MAYENGRLSASKVQAYLFCPRAYHYAYVEKKQGLKSKELRIGTIFHQRIADFLKGKTTELKLPRKWRSHFETTMQLFSGDYQVEHTMYGKILKRDAIGIADVISIDDGLIVDWKTSQTTRAYNVQAYFYHMLAKQLYNKNCEVMFVFLPSGDRIIVEEGGLEQGKRAVLQFLVGEKLQNLPKYSPESAKCRACAYSLICMVDSKSINTKSYID